ncbi:MAG: DNA-binding GntR family transcriptional regulator [Planctomycetota bacterium]
MRISEYIQRDLEFKIRVGSDLPEKLTLGAIAQLYGVSATPVRLALGELVGQNLIIRQENGRLKLNPSAPGDCVAAPPARPTDWEDVLAREVILMSMRGEDGFVREEAMAERHGIGRTLVRRVFARLAGGGLLEHIPRRGWVVPSFNHAEMDAYLVVRESLEVKALELARAHLDSTRIQAMIEGNSPGAVAAASIDNRLHAYFIEQSGNRYIAAFFDSHGRYYNALFDYAALGAEKLAEMAGQHLDILNHIDCGRWSRAQRALANHIQSQKPVMEAMIASLSLPSHSAATAHEA